MEQLDLIYNKIANYLLDGDEEDPTQFKLEVYIKELDKYVMADVIFVFHREKEIQDDGLTEEYAVIDYLEFKNARLEDLHDNRYPLTIDIEELKKEIVSESVKTYW